MLMNFSRWVTCDGRSCAATWDALVRSSLLHRRGAEAEVVEAFDGGTEKHGWGEATN
jgi:hypothetical protein